MSDDRNELWKLEARVNRLKDVVERLISLLEDTRAEPGSYLVDYFEGARLRDRLDSEQEED